MVPAAKAFADHRRRPRPSHCRTRPTSRWTTRRCRSPAPAWAPRRPKVAVTASATLTVAPGRRPHRARAGHPDLRLRRQLHRLRRCRPGLARRRCQPGSTGTLVLASKEITAFDPTTVGATGDPFDLPQGVTVLLNYQPSGAVSAALKNLQLPTLDTIAARATLSDSGFAASAHLEFGAADQGAKLFAQNTPGGARRLRQRPDAGIPAGRLQRHPDRVRLGLPGAAQALPERQRVAGRGHPRRQPRRQRRGRGVGVASSSTSPAWTARGPTPSAFRACRSARSPARSASRTARKPPASRCPPWPSWSTTCSCPRPGTTPSASRPGAEISLNLALDVNNPILGVSIAGSDCRRRSPSSRSPS